MNSKIPEKETIQQTKATSRAGEAEPECSDREDQDEKAGGQCLSRETKTTEEEERKQECKAIGTDRVNTDEAKAQIDMIRAKRNERPVQLRQKPRANKIQVVTKEMM
jgi:hypothetical protein